MNKYFKTSDAKNFAFYKVPKALFEEKYKSVSTDAKMLYGLLLDRMYLSVKNGWIDKQGRVYQYFTRQSLKRLYPNLQILSVVTTVYSFILSPKIKVQNL